MSASISTSEILEALAAAQSRPVRPDDVWTLAEIRAAMGWGRSATYENLMSIKRAGRLELCHVPREALDGRILPTPAYRFLAPKKARK